MLMEDYVKLECKTFHNVSAHFTFLKKYDIILKRQYGFQKGKNVSQLLGKFADQLNCSLSKNYQSLVLFIDFSKAFDTNPHAKLLNVPHNSGKGENAMIFSLIIWQVPLLKLKLVVV